ncbi:MAG: hypothetical protein LBP52_02605, partial [Burkholderiaceae bacterium]|nr:hypothetical protein [Burkholderiaceae bacterium]
AFSSAEGLQITFDYAAYGKWTSEDADGLSFFLIDGSTPPTLGSNFGYAAKVSTSAVTNGYVGIGLDAWGGCSALPCGVMDRVIVYGETRSSISHPTPMLTEVPLLGTAVGKIAPVDRPGRIVRITISPVSPAAPYPTVTVEIDPGSGFVKVIDAFSLAGNGPVPATFKMGFGASTGSHVDFHEVRIRSAKTLVSAVPALGQSTLGALALLLTLLTLPTLRSHFKN